MPLYSAYSGCPKSDVCCGNLVRLEVLVRAHLVSHAFLLSSICAMLAFACVCCSRYGRAVVDDYLFRTSTRILVTIDRRAVALPRPLLAWLLIIRTSISVLPITDSFRLSRMNTPVIFLNPQPNDKLANGTYELNDGGLTGFKCRDGGGIFMYTYKHVVLRAVSFSVTPSIRFLTAGHSFSR
jgi:hypothetical protein